MSTAQFGESGTGPGIGLVRYDVGSGVEEVGKNVPLVGSFVTSLARKGRVLWVATAAGFNAFDLKNKTWRTWRISPQVSLAEFVQVWNVPGGEPRGRILPGRYEVHWVGEGFLEVTTPDCIEGLIVDGSYEMLERRRFNTSPPIALSSKTTRPGGARLFSAPVERPYQESPWAWFLRVPVALLGKSQAGWWRVQACAGWIKLPPERVYLVVEDNRSPKVKRATRFRPGE